MIFENAKWIWHSDSFCENEYAEFVEKIKWNGGKNM